MHEINQKIVSMLLEEFKVWEVPKGYKMTNLSGEEQWGWPGSLDRYFMIRVTIEKERDEWNLENRKYLKWVRLS